ncbi:MAG TPA: hypothetical protein VIK59_10110 [Verrucomicrobiae bacterium]
MSTGRNNKLAGQIGEYLVCAELGKRGLIATPFSGNVPAFDVLATDEVCRTVPIQVKASRGDNWPGDARNWMDIDFDEKTGVQNFRGPAKIKNKDLVHVFIAISPDEKNKDRFFILTKSQLQKVCVKRYSDWMNERGWKRPRNPKSYDCRFWIADVLKYEDNWKLIENRLTKTSPDKSLESTEE